MIRVAYRLLALIILTTVFSGIGYAQSDNPASTGFALRPAIVEISAEPGTSTKHTIAVENTSDRALPIELEAQSLIPIDDIIDLSRRSEFDASSWIKPEKTDFLFEPGEVEEVSFTVNVPEDANPGGHYAILAIRPLIIEGASTADGNTIVIPEIGTSIFITVPGDIQESAELVADNIVSSRVTKSKSTPLKFSLRNTGNVHILPSPRITVSKNGETVEIFNLQPQLVLPNTEKTFSVEWDADVDYGNYQVRAELTYGNQGIPLSSGDTSFSVWPSIPQVVGLLLLGLVTIFLLTVRKNIPKALSVLKGQATSLKGRFSRYGGKDNLTDDDKRGLDEIAKEIDAQPSILGLPEEDPIVFLEEMEEEFLPKPIIKAKKSQVMSKTTLTTEHQTTNITQTSSSTIVRETKLKPAPSPKTVTKINVIDHYETPKAKPAPKKKTTKETATKKTLTKTKKTSTKKKAATKKKPATKKSTANKKSAPKKKSTAKK